jgi:hypothetical protein
MSYEDEENENFKRFEEITAASLLSSPPIPSDQQKRCLYCCIDLDDYSRVMENIRLESMSNGELPIDFAYFIPFIDHDDKEKRYNRMIEQGHFVSYREANPPRNLIINYPDDYARLCAFFDRRERELEEDAVFTGQERVYPRLKHRLPLRFNELRSRWIFSEKDKSDFCSWNCVCRYGSEMNDSRLQREYGMNVRIYLHSELTRPIQYAIQEKFGPNVVMTAQKQEELDLMRSIIRLNELYIQSIRPSFHRSTLQCFGGDVTYTRYIREGCNQFQATSSTWSTSILSGMKPEFQQQGPRGDGIQRLDLDETNQVPTNVVSAKRRVESYRIHQLRAAREYNAYREEVFQKAKELHEVDVALRNSQKTPATTTPNPPPPPPKKPTPSSSSSSSSSSSAGRVSRKRNHRETMKWFDEHQQPKPEGSSQYHHHHHNYYQRHQPYQQRVPGGIGNNSVRGRQNNYRKFNNPSSGTSSSSSSNNNNNGKPTPSNVSTTTTSTSSQQQRKNNNSHIKIRSNQQFANFIRKKANNNPNK